MSTVRIDSAFVDIVFEGFHELTLKVHEQGQQDIELEIIPGVVLCREFMNSSLSRYRLNTWRIAISNDHFKGDHNETKRIIARSLGLHLCDETGDNVKLRELFDGILLSTLLTLPMGIDIKFTRDSDNIVMMVSETAAPHHPLYAFEAAVNQERSISPRLLHNTNVLLDLTWDIVSDFILADLSPVEYTFSTEL